MLKQIGGKAFLCAVSLVASFVWAIAAYAQKAPAIEIPKTVSGIWQSIDKEVDTAAKLIQAGTVTELHNHAFNVRDLIAALLAQSSSLPADKSTKIKADSRLIPRLAAGLDTAGDLGNKAASIAMFDQLKDTLKTIRANYPELAAK
ncbi:MAG: hypothetical protein EXQ89_04655 [Rhodospirillaceae bacterium]|nr:hypothetical protein [Rhodospirillaceae bacterium]